LKKRLLVCVSDLTAASLERVVSLRRVLVVVVLANPSPRNAGKVVFVTLVADIGGTDNDAGAAALAASVLMVVAFPPVERSPASGRATTTNRKVC
jgi:hypothetical protein